MKEPEIRGHRRYPVGGQDLGEPARREDVEAFFRTPPQGRSFGPFAEPTVPWWRRLIRRLGGSARFFG